MKDEIEYLTFEDLVEIGEALIPNFQIRDLGLLKSAALRPSTVIYGKQAYPTFPEKVSALMHSLASNHTLVDGNKRLTWAGGRLFALLNNFDFQVEIDEAENVMIQLASGNLDARTLTPIIKRWLNN